MFLLSNALFEMLAADTSLIFPLDKTGDLKENFIFYKCKKMHSINKTTLSVIA